MTTDRCSIQRMTEPSYQDTERNAEGGVFATLGLEPTLFAFQLLNFFVVLLVVWFLILKPLTKKMDERKKIIDESLDRAKEIETKMGMAERLAQEKTAEARQVGDQIVARSHEEARALSEKMKVEAKKEIARLVEQAKDQLAEEKVQTVAELKREAGALAIAVAEKILAEKIDQKKDAAIIERAVNSITK